MLKYISVLCGALLFMSACGAKTDSASSENPSDSLKKSLENYSKACGDVAFAQTKAKLAIADEADVAGNKDGARVAVEEAIQLFKAEEPNYQTLNSANDAQNTRIGEVTARRDAVDSQMTAFVSGSNHVQELNTAWENAKGAVNTHIDAAKAAYEVCDPAKAQAELDAAAAILDEAEQFIADNQAAVVVEESAAVVVEGKVYVVKKGDCLWTIADREYSNPFMWPVIYWANKGGIKDPDLIFPGQNFDIVFDFAETDQVKAAEFAKTRGPWSLYDNK